MRQSYQFAESNALSILVHHYFYFFIVMIW